MPGVAPAAPAGAVGVGALRDHLQQLYASRPPRAVYAEEAVRLLARATSAKAAALLLYDARSGRLQLLSHADLDRDALAALSGESAASTWDIPLRSLRNRRINVIEAAHDNPFVPKSLTAISPRRLSIAALPFFHANAPVGVAVLFSPNPRGFTDAALTTLSQALRVCALAFSELPAAPAASAAIEPDAAGGQPTLLRGLAALKAELARLTEALETAERERATEAAERVTAQSFLKAARERGAQLERELAALRAEHERMPALETRVDELTGQLAAAHEAGAAARARIDELQAQLTDRERQATDLDAAFSDLTAQRHAVEEQLRAASDAARARAEEVSALRTSVAELTAQASQAAELHAALSAASATQASASAAVAELRDELRAAQNQRAQVEAELSALRAAMAAAAEEHERLLERLAEKDLLLQSAEQNLNAFDLDADDEDVVFAIQRDGAASPLAAADAPAVVPALDGDAGELIVLDDSSGAAQAVARLIEFGRRAAALPATVEAAQHLRGRQLAGAAINLGGAAAWSMLRHLRNGSGIPHMPLVAYALSADGPRGFWLGAVDFAMLPVADLELPALLQRLGPKVKRVLAMSNDIDVMSDVRAQLSDAGISTAVVLDGRQALDLVPTIRPEAAVLHLSPHCADVFRAIAGLRAAEISRDIPMLFLLDAEAEAREEAFLSAGVRLLTGRGALAPEELAGHLAAAL
ncbi:MAG: GAF domain-containing protein [Candidatus Binatia bacterium]